MTFTTLPLTIGDYHRDKTAISNSGKERFRYSSTLYDLEYVQCVRTRPTSPALKLGNWLHCATLEPDRWRDEFVCGLPKGTPKQHRDLFVLEHMGKQIVPHKDYQNVIAWRRAIRENDDARFYLDQPGEVEFSYSWIDPISGLTLKSRPDKTLTKLPIMLDVKTARRADPHSFHQEIGKWGYARTEDWRMRGHFARTDEWLKHVFIVVGKETEECGVYELDGLSVHAAREENNIQLERMAECYRTGDWRPWWSKQVNMITAPAWANKSSVMEGEEDEQYASENESEY